MVKVRRPGIDRTITLDMQLLAWLAESLENFMPELRVYRPAMLVSELEVKAPDIVGIASGDQKIQSSE